MNDKDLFPVILFTTFALLLLLITALVVIIAAHRQRLHQKIQLARTQTRYQQELRNVATEVQEQSFANISEELHNNIGQRLTLVHMQLQACGAAPQNAETMLAKAGANLIDAMKQVRQLSHALSAEMITNQGLSSMIRQEVSRLQHNGRITVIYTEDGEEPDLSPDQRLVAFRFLQEAINNVLKHAAATHLHLHLCARPVFKLDITDDGRGFDRTAITQRAGAGIRHMQHRAGIANMQCTVLSTPGSGTRCSITAG